MTALSETIAALFERAASEPKAEATVQRGLNLKARIVNGQRQLLLSRPDVQPSDLEVMTCAKHGQIAAYTVSHAARWQLIMETTDLCQHVQGFSGRGDSKTDYFYFGSCTACHARWQLIVSRRGKGSTYTYNGQEVTDWQYQLLAVRGPKGELSTETDDEHASRQMAERAAEQSKGTVPSEPRLLGQVCGTCRNGLPTDYPNEVECQLGWEAHDPKLAPGYNTKTKKPVPCVMAHGSLALPILTPNHRCVADKWLPT